PSSLPMRFVGGFIACATASGANATGPAVVAAAVRRPSRSRSRRDSPRDSSPRSRSTSLWSLMRISLQGQLRRVGYHSGTRLTSQSRAIPLADSLMIWSARVNTEGGIGRPSSFAAFAWLLARAQTLSDGPDEREEIAETMFDDIPGDVEVHA